MPNAFWSQALIDDPTENNPYKGLSALDTKDREQLFGRNDHIKQLYQQFQQLYESESVVRFLPIYGAPGVGKTSLAKAGLLSELAQQPLQVSAKVTITILKPGRHPLRALATSVCQTPADKPDSMQELQRLETRLWQADEFGAYAGLGQIASAQSMPTASSLIVLVDQWEEVYTLCDDAAERTAFIQNLLYAARDCSKQVSVIATMQIDFLDEVQKCPALYHLFSTQSFLVPALGELALREAIEKPAELSGYPLGDEIVDQIITQTKEQKDVLPLLQFMLWCQWLSVERGMPPEVALDTLGGINNALTRKADRVLLRNLLPPHQSTARHIFCSLVKLREGKPAICDRVLIESLVSDRHTLTDVQHVLTRFTAPSLQFITHTSENGIETVEITHEVVLRNWVRLKQWLDESRSDLRFQQRLTIAADDWQKSGQTEDNSWKASDLELLQHYCKCHGGEITPLQAAFLTAPVKTAEKEKEKIKHKRRISKAFLAIFVGLFIFALLQTQQSARFRIKNLAIESENRGLLGESTDATIYAIVATKLSQSTFVRFSNLPLHILSKVSSWSFYNAVSDAIAGDFDSSATISLRDATLANVERNVIRDSTVSIRNEEMTSVALSPDGEVVAGAWGSGAVGLWNTTTGELIKNFRARHAFWPAEMAFSPDGKTIAGADQAGLILIDLERGIPNGRWLHQPNDDWITSVAFSPDGMLLASNGRSGVQLRDPRTGSPIGNPLKDLDTGSSAIAFSSDSRTLASGRIDGTLRLWDVETRKPIGRPLAGHSGSITSVAFSPGGKMVASASRDGTVRRWKSTTGESIGEPMSGESMRKHNGHALSVAFSPDGKVLASGGTGDVIRLWNAETGGTIGELPEYSSNSNYERRTTWSVAFSPDGATLASADEYAIRIWDTSLITEPPQLGFSDGELIETACNQLRYNPSLQEPQNPVQRKAKRICTRYNRSKN